MGIGPSVSEALYHEVVYMAQASPEIRAGESAWVEKLPFESDLSVPKTVGSECCQGAELDESPADLQSPSHRNYPYSESVRLAMHQAEAQEYGLTEDDSGDDPFRIPDDILAEMGIKPDEVGQLVVFRGRSRLCMSDSYWLG